MGPLRPGKDRCMSPKNFQFRPPFVFGIDPVTLTAIGLGISALAGAGGTVASLANRPKAPAAPMTPPTPAPEQQPQGSQTSGQPQQSPSFLAAAAAPTQQQTIGGGQGKTLLGQ